MAATNVLFYTRRASTAFNTYGVGKKVVKTHRRPSSRTATRSQRQQQRQS